MIADNSNSIQSRTDLLSEHEWVRQHSRIIREIRIARSCVGGSLLLFVLTICMGSYQAQQRIQVAEEYRLQDKRGRIIGAIGSSENSVHFWISNPDAKTLFKVMLPNAGNSTLNFGHENGNMMRATFNNEFFSEFILQSSATDAITLRLDNNKASVISIIDKTGTPVSLASITDGQRHMSSVSTKSTNASASLITSTTLGSAFTSLIYKNSEFQGNFEFLEDGTLQLRRSKNQGTEKEQLFRLDKN